MLRHVPLSAIAGCLIALGGISPAAAAQVDRLTLAEVIRRAELRDLTLRIALSDSAAVAYERAHAWGMFLPDLRLSLSTGGSYSRTLTGTNQFGEPVRREIPLTATGSYGSQGLSLGGAVWDPSRIPRMREVVARTRGAVARVRTERAHLHAEVAREYHTLLMNERIVRYEERMLEAARGRRALTERKLPHLGSGPLDLLRADLAVSEQRQLVERAQGQVAKGKLELSLRMGVRDTAFSLVEEVPQVFDPRIFDADQLVELAISANPRIEQLAAAERAAQHRINAGNGARWPTLSFSTGLTRGFHRSGYGALFTVDPPNVSVSFGLSTSFTVFDQFRSANNRQSIRIAHTNTQLHLQSGRMETEKAVRIALMDLRTAYDEFQIAQASSRLAVLANTSANEQYQRGILRFEDVQDVVIQTTRAERAVDLARLAFIRALLTLEEVVGAPLSNVST